uniref:Uncharacterized protein n=1 Tax=Cyclophora tenuis TaxID=216820 RepID=A0A7S1D2U6_CYCTE
MSMSTERQQQQQQQLQLLDLRYNDICGVQGAQALSTYLSQSSLEILHLEGNELGDEGTEALCKSTTSMSSSLSLRELYLGQNKIGPIGGRALARSLPTLLSRVKKLYLDGNDIGTVGAKAFIDVLEEAMTDNEKVLEKLYVDNNGIAKDEAIRLGAALNSATMIGSSAFYQE